LLQVLEPTLQTIETTTLSIVQLEEQLQARTKDDTQVRRLKTMPGIGPLTSVAFVAAVDELGRFARPAQLASYFGLTPGENTTGGKQRFTGVTKAGKSQVRTLLIQAAWTHVRVAPQSALSQKYHELTQRRPKQVAIVAVARRMVHALYAMMRDEQPFNPQHARPASRETTPAPVDALSSALRSEVEEDIG
jgi:transposase